jgi:hypothetical protein
MIMENTAHIFIVKYYALSGLNLFGSFLPPVAPGVIHFLPLRGI